MESYIRLLDQYEDYQGGFIWDYIDQALFVKDEVTGRDVLRYGGDFDDRPSDYEFSGKWNFICGQNGKAGNAGGETLLWITQIEEN